MLFAGLAACASAAHSAEDNGQWLYDTADAPPGASFDSTGLNDPEYEDYADNPIHHFEADGLEARLVLEWYRETLAEDGWRIDAADEHQLIATRFRSQQQHILLVETYTPVDERFDSFTVEEYLAER
jgi:hypothetical protein